MSNHRSQLKKKSSSFFNENGKGFVKDTAEVETQVVVKSRQSGGSFTSLGDNIEGVVDKLLNSTENPVEKAQVPTGDIDSIDKLMNIVTEGQRNNTTRKCLLRALKAGHSVDYLMNAVAYSNAKATKSYSGHLGKTIDLEWAPEGFYKETVEEQKELEQKKEKALAREQKKRQEDVEQQERMQEAEEHRKKIDEALMSVDIDELDAFIEKQELNCFNRKRFNVGNRTMLRWMYVLEFKEIVCEKIVMA